MLYSKNINVSYNWYATIYNYLYSLKLDCKFFNFPEIQKNQTPKKLRAWGKNKKTHTQQQQQQQKVLNPNFLGQQKYGEKN